MVLQQEAEEVATLTYIRPLLDRLQSLGKQQSASGSQLTFDTNKSNESLYSDLCQRSITYGEINRALDLLEGETPEKQFITQDKQLMMILKLLTHKHSEAADDVPITWAEIIHCYRMCILGMSTLKHMPKDQYKAVRLRAKDRILSQLSLFELPSTKLLNEQTKFDSSDLDMGDNTVAERWPKSKARHVRATAVIAVFAAASVGSDKLHPEGRTRRFVSGPHYVTFVLS